MKYKHQHSFNNSQNIRTIICRRPIHYSTSQHSHKSLAFIQQQIENNKLKIHYSLIIHTFSTHSKQFRGFKMQYDNGKEFVFINTKGEPTANVKRLFLWSLFAWGLSSNFTFCICKCLHVVYKCARYNIWFSNSKNVDLLQRKQSSIKVLCYFLLKLLKIFHKHTPCIINLLLLILKWHCFRYTIKDF